MRIVALLVLLALSIGCSATGNQTGRQPLMVFAAASLNASFQEIAAAFEQAHPNVKVEFNFAGSNGLRTQLEQGARADVFASANTVEIEKAQASGLLQGNGSVFARNRLVVIVPASNPAQIGSIQDLGRPGIRLVIAGEAVPVGGYTLEMLEQLAADPSYGSDFGYQVRSNVISEETNVKQVVAKVELGEADAGIVYVSDAAAGRDLQSIPVPDEYNPTAVYPIAILANSSNPDGARAFVDYVLSSEGQDILKQHGFLPAMTN